MRRTRAESSTEFFSDASSSSSSSSASSTDSADNGEVICHHNGPLHLRRPSSSMEEAAVVVASTALDDLAGDAEENEYNIMASSSPETEILFVSWHHYQAISDVGGGYATNMDELAEPEGGGYSFWCWRQQQRQLRYSKPRSHSLPREQRQRQHRKQRLSSISILLPLSIILSLATAIHSSGGYLSHPPSRNFLAFQSNKILPSSSHPLSSLPEFEPTPHSLNAGKTCGSADGGMRNYNSPKSREGNLLPLNIQGIYSSSEREINIKVSLFGGDLGVQGGHGGGHFDFSLCPLTYPQTPTEECFERYPLKFVRDEYYGAVKDENYPERAYLPFASAFSNNNNGGSNNNNNNNGGGRLQPVISSNLGPGNTPMMEFSYVFQLPKNAPELVSDLTSLEMGGVPNANTVEGTTFVEHTTLAQSFLSKRGGRPRGGHRELQQQQSKVVHSKTSYQSNESLHSKQSVHSKQTLEQSVNDIWEQYQARQSPPVQAPVPTPPVSAPSSPISSRTPDTPPQQQWIATQTNHHIVPSSIETVLISSLTTDGNGTTTIVTLNGDVTVIEGGPKVEASMTLTYGSKAIYGKGIDLDSLPEEVKDTVLNNGSSGSAGGVGGLGSQMNSEAVNEGTMINESEGSGKESSATNAFVAGLNGVNGASSKNNDRPTFIIPNTASTSSSSTPNTSTTPTTTTNTSSSKYVLLRWHYTTARDCYPPGYDQYNWPLEWGTWQRQWGGECFNQQRNVGFHQEEFWNCAEILIVGSDHDNGGGGSSGSHGGDAVPRTEVEPEMLSAMPQMQSESMIDQNVIFAKDDTAQTTGTNPVTIDVTANDTGNSLVVTGTRDGRHGSCKVTEDNKVVYTPNVVGFGGKRDRCAYMICIDDGTLNTDEVGGGGGGGGVMCDEGWVYIMVFQTGEESVLGQPQASTASSFAAFTVVGSINAKDDTISTTTNVPIKIDVAANDEYTSSKDGKKLPVVVDATNAFHGTCRVVTNSNVVLYTPNVDFEGWDRCTYKICLGSGGGEEDDGTVDDSVCNYAQINISVSVEESEPEPPKAMLANLNPIAKPDSITVVQNDYAYIDVLANDSDPENEDLRVYSWTSTENGGVVGYVENEGLVRYAPPEGYIGMDSFKYTVCNASFRCDTAPVTVKVISEVFARDDEATAVGTTPIYVEVTANDYTSSNKPLQLLSVNQAMHGTCDIIGAQIRYTLTEEGFEGWDRCGYMVCSGEECDKGRLEIRVLPAQIFEVGLETTISNNNNSNRPPRPVRPEKPVEEKEEDVIIPVNQVVEEKPEEPQEDESKPFRPVTQTASEAGLEKVYAEDEVVTTLLNSPIVIDVTHNDFVKGMGYLEVTRTDGATNGRCKLTDNNEVRYSPDRGFVGTDHCAYVVCETSMPNVLCDEGIVAINVVDQEEDAKPLVQQEFLLPLSTNNNGGDGDDLVSNHESSGGLSIGLNKQRAGPSANSGTSSAVDCEEYHKRGGNLRGGTNGDPCIAYNAVTEESSSASTHGSYEITYTSTQVKKKNRLPNYLINNSVLRLGRTASNSLNEEQEESELQTQTVITVPASADAVIMPGFPDKCFGKVPSILVSGPTSSAGLHETLLQFHTSEVDKSVCKDGLVESASIYLYGLVHSTQGGAFVTTSDTSWSEDDVTWNTAPASDGIILMDTTRPVQAQAWYSVDVTPALLLGETLSIRLIANEEDNSVAQYASRDHSEVALRPVLNITCVSG